MEAITVTAPDISCEHCQRAIERAIGSLPGVHSVRVVIPAKTVEISYDPARISRDTIMFTLDEEGYPIAS